MNVAVISTVVSQPRMKSLIQVLDNLFNFYIFCFVWFYFSLFNRAFLSIEINIP
ncbi:hypothetical protein DFP75_101126 [Marinomonas alcarazii]|uniref:Uncharacterized protein n=1 Tax=Marinomonas alcarazii TaxID=491949 RepID=A0A318V8F1_9GAMM|nr:hypothetical protein DFP75_101126 [Marinomonas alcarazii]